MWLLMSRLVDTHFLIAHWGFPSFHLGHWHDWLYWLIILIGDSDTVIFFVLHWYICLRYLTCWLWWLIRIDRGFRDSYFLCASLIYSFEIWTCWLYWSIISYCLAHWSWFCHDYSYHFTCIHSPLYITQFDMLILWLVYPLDRLWAWCIYLSFFLSVYHGLCGHEWYTCTLLDCVVHDYPSFVWLHVACLCGPHIYPLTSNSLGLGHFLHFGSHFCKCEAFCVLVFWPSQRLGVGSSDGLYRCLGAFWRRATLWCREESDHWRPV